MSWHLIWFIDSYWNSFYLYEEYQIYGIDSIDQITGKIQGKISWIGTSCLPTYFKYEIRYKRFSF